jgi:prophage regulatory protein
MTTKTAARRAARKGTPSNAPNPERRRLMWEARQQGRTCADIGLEFGICAQRVSDLAAKHERTLRQQRGALKTTTAAPTPVAPKPKLPAAPALSRALLSHDDLRDLGVTYSRWSLTRLVKEGRFPAPVALGPGRKAWRAAEVEAWLAGLAPAA